MNYNNMYTNKRPDSIDPNYIYPQPYLDPIMYMNPYAMSNEALASYNPLEYESYSNPYVDNNPYDNLEDEYFFDNMYNPNNDTGMHMNNPIIPMMPPPNMMFPGMAPYMNMMPPNMMNPNSMFPGMMPYMNMMSNMPAVNMEEFDEEEM